MHISPHEIEMPITKITEYLLVKKEKNDKSAFLAKLGYTIENYNELVNDIKNLHIGNQYS